MLEEKILFDTVIQKEADPRDYTVAMFIPNQTEVKDEEFMLEMPEVEMILDQGSIGSCVAHSLVTAAKILNWKLSNKILDFSPMALYGSRFDDHHQGSGMVPSEAVDVVRKEGLFYKRDFDTRKEMPQLKYDVSTFKRNNPTLVEEAKKFQICGYGRIPIIEGFFINNAKTALKNGMPIIAMYALYRSFYNVRSNGKVTVPNPSTEQFLGYHEMVIVGWTKNNEWIVVNSWGLDNGLKGLYLIPFNYKPHEMLTITDTISPCKPKAKKIITTVGSNIINVDGVDKEVDVTPYISEDNRTMVPVRFISEFLGASVEWIESSQQVTVRSEEHTIRLYVGGKMYYIDDEYDVMDTVPVIKNDRTFLPIRYVAEALKCKVTYKEENGTQIIEINSL